LIDMPPLSFKKKSQIQETLIPKDK